MSLKSSLMRYYEENRIVSFDAHTDKKATLRLKNGTSVLMYMATQYIIGEADIAEAVETPCANHLVYNAWDTVSRRARDEARRLGVNIYTFGEFGNYLEQLNAN